MESSTVIIILTGISIVMPFIANITQSIFSNIKKSQCCGATIEMRDIPIKQEKIEIPNIKEILPK